MAGGLKRPFVLLCLLLPVLLAAGCNKNNTESPQVPIPEDDIADMIANAVSENSATYGFSAQMEDVATLAETGGVITDTTIVHSRQLAGFSHYTYTFHYQCGYSAPRDSFWTVYAMHGYYTAHAMSSIDSANGVWSALHVAGPDSQLLINGTSIRHGSQNSLVREKNQFTSVLTDSLIDIRVNKASKRIRSGVLTVSVSGTGSDGAGFSYAGTLTFFGNSQASLILDDQTYLIDMSAGSATLSPE